MDTKINGLILGGGKSSRMGVDKGIIDFHGLPQREFLHGVLIEFCDKVFYSCKSSHGVPRHLNPLEDAFTIESPLNGILTAFQYDSDHAWLTVPVDMPAIKAQVINHLLQHRDRKAMASCYYDSEGVEPEPLLCIWERHAWTALQQYAADGNISPKRFLMNGNVKLLSSPFPNLHQNINSKEELERFKQSKPYS